MDSRVAAPLLAALLVLVACAPAGVAAGERVGDDAVAAGGGGDALVVDRLRPAVASSGPARAGGRADRSVDADGVLEQSTRADVYAAAEASPGETLAGLAAAVGVAKSTVRYHVDVLRGADLLAATEVAGALRVAPAGADVELEAVLHAEETRTVLDAVAAHEPASVTTLAGATDRAPSTVSHHLSALEERGLVERERDGEAVVTTLAPATRAALAADPPAGADD